MKIKIRNELIPLNLLVIVLIIAITLFPSNGIRIALGLPYLLFFPGYTLVAALFLKREEMGAVEKIALSLGMSIAVVSLIGLILNFSPWGITLELILYPVAAFIFVMSIVAWLRRKWLREQARFVIEFQLRLPSFGGNIWDRVLFVILVLSIVGTLGTLGYVIAKPKVGEKFTEFYVLGEAGKLADYPLQLKVGDTGKVVVGIINREYQDMYYRVEIRLSDTLIEKLGPVRLEHEQKWEQEVNIIPANVGEKQRLKFVLYNNGEPHRQLHLWVSVTEQD